LEVIRHIKQQEAAKRIGVTTRQGHNLDHVYREYGASSLIHGNHGRESVPERHHFCKILKPLLMRGLFCWHL
jgi:hypothetical protein